MSSKKTKNKFKKFMKLVNKQYKLENQLQSVNKKLSRCKPEIFIYEKKNDFAEIREKYFLSLQCAVAENLKCCRSDINEETIENMSLIVEQDALLASIQQSAYQRAVSEIIKEIREATSRNNLYPTISLNLTLTNDLNTKISSESPDPDKASLCVQTNGLDRTENIAWVVPKVEEPALEDNEEPAREDYEEPAPEDYEVPYQTDEMPENNPEIDPDLADFIINFEGIDDELNQEVPHSYDHYDIEGLIGILEGNEKTGNSETDPNAETENSEKVQDVIHSKSRINEKLTAKRKHAPPVCSHRLPSLEMWQNERYIYTYKVLKNCSQMDAQQFFRTRKLFNYYFGEDSDFEQEDEFADKEKYLHCCSRRIIPIVVQLITPYREQIRGTDIFKQLTQRIANSVVTINDSPSHSQIQQYVAKFFANGKKFMDLSDVWLLEVD